MPATVGLALCSLVASAPVGAASAAHFWLSTSGVATAGPSNGVFAPTVGQQTRLYLWGRPADDRRFDAVSLNVVANGPLANFVDGSYQFYNAIDGSTDRFEFIVDSTTTPVLTSAYTPFELGLGGVVDGVYGLNGFNLTDTSSRGMGPVCRPGEMNCVVAGDGEPAWLIAALNVGALGPGSVDLHLQVGDRGVVERTIAVGDYDLNGETAQADHAVWAAGYGTVAAHVADGNGDGVVDAADYTLWRDHEGDVGVLLDAADTEVRFGADAMAGDEPLYNGLTDRDVTLLGDDPDATLTITPPALAVPEPAAAASLAMALGGLISNRRLRPTGVEN